MLRCSFQNDPGVSNCINVVANYDSIVRTTSEAKYILVCFRDSFIMFVCGWIVVFALVLAPYVEVVAKI